MRPYFSNYSGRVYEFKVMSIEQTDLEYDILNLQNMETLRITKLNSNTVHAPDSIQVGDTIIRQYTREGVGIYGKYIGGYQSQGNTQYIDTSSINRYYEQHPLEKHKKLIFSVLFIVFLIILLTIS